MKLKSLFIFATLALHLPANASTFTWQQAAGTTNNWSAAAGDTNWFIDAGTTLSPWADANAAVFNGTTGETVTLIGTLAPTSIDAGTGNGNWTLNGTGVISGTGTTLTKNGTGTLTLASTVANTYTGGTTINGGTISIGTGGTGANTATVGALGTGAVTVGSGGTLKFWIQNSTAFTYTNPMTLTGGTLMSEDGTNTVSGAITLGAGSTLLSHYTGKPLISSGVISGAFPLSVGRASGSEAGAAVILTGANTFSGGTTVLGGVLQLGNAVATDYGGTGRVRGAITVNSGATLLFQGNNTTGYNAGSKVNAITLNSATLTNAGTGDNGWGVAYTLTGSKMQATGTGARFSFGGPTGAGTTVTTLASATTSTITGAVVIREGNVGDNIPFSVADGAAATDLLVSANISQNAAGRSITKSGAGTMAMAGLNTYTGATTINGGTLVLASGGTLPSSAITVNSATFQSDVAGRTHASLAVNGTSGLSFVAAPAAPTTITGALAFGDASTVNVNVVPGGLLTAGTTYDLVSAGSLTGTPTLTTTLPAGTRVTGTVSISGNKLQFNALTGSAALVWNNAAATSTWDLDTSANFLNGAANDVFKSYDMVTFDDSVTPGAVTLTGSLTPGLLTVNNSAGDYSFIGSGSLTGSSGLVKSGSSKLTLGGTMVYSLAGPLTAGGTGTLDLGARSITPSALSLTGATLANGTVTSPVFDIQSGTSTAVLAGTAGLTKSTAGSATLNAVNTYTGVTTVSAGTLTVANASAISTGTTTVTGGQLNFDVSYTVKNTLTVNGGTVGIKNGTTFTSDSPTLVFAGAGGTLTSYTGTGSTAILQGFDINSADIVVNAGTTAASIDPSVIVATRTYGFRLDVGGTANLTVAGPITGNGAAASAINSGTLVGTDLPALFKRGTGNLTLTGASTFTAGATVGASPAATSLQEGSITLSGGNDRLPVTSAVYLGNTLNTSGKLILNGINQTVTGLGVIGTGLTNAVVGGSATIAMLTVNNTNDYTFSGLLGGTGTNENNLALVKSGAGKLTLSNATNSYTGDTTVSGGTLTLNSATLADASAVRLSTGATLNLTSASTDTIAQFYIDGVLQAPGTWGALDSTADHKTALITGSGLLLVPGSVPTTPYATWSTARGLTEANNAFSADPDQDGATNLAEFALDGDPLSGLSDGKTTSSVSGGVLTYTLPVRKGAVFSTDADGVTATLDGVTYRIQASTDLLTWTLPVSTTTADLTGRPTLSDIAGWEYRAFQVPAGNDKAFIRAKVTAP